jgi:hypothetical protein
MIAKIIALLEGLRAADIDATAPAHLERFAALCRHWAGLADVARSAPRGVPHKPGERSE